MPMYEYYCKDCDHRFEQLKSIKESHRVNCPKCGKLSEKQVTICGLVFKGSGFYVNDYKSGGK
jgi:putative FmdB family regulatory protein